MSNVISLDDLRKDLDREFAPLVIDLGKGEVTLLNVLRLGVEDRQAVSDEIAKVTTDEGDVKVDERFQAMQNIFTLVAKDGKGEALVSQIGDDYQLAMKILGLWTEATQPGEAQSSPA